ncbi:hypothetical protein [Cryobacterium sp. MDB2-10]|uniref:hypothetical protein n=1 Tax=Cryobacterium sp. MDB2-10 TaxID=1259177 RepID=UPI001072F65B|nr:hypothetical protein [Cryobacterium sp. MDB2-10]TFC19891.1 hypothetical protein E3O51_06015 [Cryobacterium sp. MDB2-10]
MDLEEDFYETVKATVATLIRKGKPTSTWTDDEGHEVTGWMVGHGSSHSPAIKGNPGQGWWEETWGNSCQILDTTGVFWEYSFYGVESSSHPQAILSKSLRASPSSYLVGAAGKPFSRKKAEIERLPYL